MRRLIVPLIFILLILGVYLLIPQIAARVYGPASPALTRGQRFQYAVRLLWYDGILSSPTDIYGAEQSFRVDAGEPVASIANRLQEAGLIGDANALRIYLVYSGLDKTIQAGDYTLSPSLSAMDIADALQDATPAQITFTVFPGWRMEEIAASLPTSGLSITPDAFLAAAQTPPAGLDFLVGAATSEGFLFPDSYTLPRVMTASQLVTELARNFALHLSPDMREGFARHGLTVYQAVTLASIVQREAVVPDEQPLIASVFLNRLEAGMKLESDPTVQYALGYDETGKTWWKNPLTLDDLSFDSPYNTYLYPGLPPAPIGNPSLGALQAVAFPAQTPYYYFRARCDGSGQHAFAETFAGHLANACP